MSVDGGRQDFVVAGPPGGAGPLRVDLAVNGAKVEALACGLGNPNAGSGDPAYTEPVGRVPSRGVRLVLNNSGRKLAYSRLRVVDARGQVLQARLEVVSENRVAVVVEDADATYPVRIDPTFSDANWVSMGGFPGTDGMVMAAVVDASGSLFIAGEFNMVGDAPATNIAKWNGSAWSALGSGMNGGVSALAVSGTDLYAGGSFTTAGGITANRIAKWNGTAWSALGSGMNSYVGALAVSGTNLYAGGTFTTAGGKVSVYVAKAVLTPPSGPPVIETQPSNQTVEVGRTAKFSVTASGQLPLSYQWRFYGTNLADQTSASLVLTGVATNQAGPYSVVVTNVYGSVTSSVATLTVVLVLTLGEALDAPQLLWSSGGNAPWTAQTAVTHDGVDAAQSGTISHSQETWMETSVVGPGPLSFWWTVSSESGYDYLEFYTNGVRVIRIAGDVSWQQQTHTLGTGAQVLRWRYMKDSSASSGQDRGWVDQVSFAPVRVRPVIMVNDDSFGMRTNRFGFDVSGTAGQVVIVEGSSNLSNWLPLQTNTLGSGPVYFSDPATSTFPWRFYRARVAP